MPIVFLIFLLIWLGAAYWFFQKRDVYRLFGFLLSSFLLYISFELLLWSLRLPLWIMMCVGLLPVIGVAYGYRVYDYKQREAIEKRKNDDKLKREETAAI